MPSLVLLSATRWPRTRWRQGSSKDRLPISVSRLFGVSLVAVAQKLNFRTLPRWAQAKPSRLKEHVITYLQTLLLIPRQRVLSRYQCRMLTAIPSAMRCSSPSAQALVEVAQPSWPSRSRTLLSMAHTARALPHRRPSVRYHRQQEWRRKTVSNVLSLWTAIPTLLCSRRPSTSKALQILTTTVSLSILRSSSLLQARRNTALLPTTILGQAVVRISQ